MTSLATPLNLVSFVSIDVETTGLDPTVDQIVELGAVKVQAGQIVDQFDTLVRIQGTIPFAARRVHGITNKMLVGKPSIAEALPLFFEFIGDSALVEHSHEAFDVAFIEQAHGSRLTAPFVNTCTLSRKLFPHLPKHGLQECCHRFNIANEQQHRALPDARATANLLVCLLNLSASRYPRLQDLVAVASVERTNSSTGKQRASRSPARRRRPPSRGSAVSPGKPPRSSSP